MRYMPYPATNQTITRYVSFLPTSLIDPQILRNMPQQLDLSNRIDSNFWVVCLLLFYSLLHKGSVLPNAQKSLNTVTYFYRSEVIVHSWGMMVHVRNTKTIQFQGRRRLSILLRRNIGSVLLCPVQAMFHAFTFARHQPNPSPTFVLRRGSGFNPVTGPMFSQQLRLFLRHASLDLYSLPRIHFAVRGVVCCARSEYSQRRPSAPEHDVPEIYPSYP